MRSERHNFCHCEGAGVRWTPLRSRSTDRAGRRDAKRLRQSVLPLSSLRSCVSDCGNPFSPKGDLRILSRFALRMTHNLVIAKPCKRLWQSVPFVIAVRVSGGHLCEAEAPTEPAGETAERCAAIRFSFFKNTILISNHILISHTF